MITAHHIHTLKKATFTLLAVLLTTFVFVILLTYSPNDPSWSRISSDMGEVSNMGGAVGAWISDLLYTFFGWPAWWLMVFLAFEALSLWWEREQAFGLLRVIAYVFVLLANCGLIVIFPQIFGFDGEGTAQLGGILGTEVATRLANLLTEYGAGLFLGLFFIITTTFAFDIHWIRLFKQVASLSWLGSGVNRDDREESRDDLAYEENGEDDDEYDLSSEPDDLRVAHDSESPLMEQLKIKFSKDSGSDESSEQESQYNAALNNEESESQESNQTEHSYVDLPLEPSSNDSAFNHVLDEFLLNSGLTETMLAIREEEARSESEMQSNHNTHSENSNSQTAGQGKSETDIQKQEPSFAWNDQKAIDDLLDEQALSVKVANNPPYVNSDSQDIQTSNVETYVKTEFGTEVETHSTQPHYPDIEGQQTFPVATEESTDTQIHSVETPSINDLSEYEADTNTETSEPEHYNVERRSNTQVLIKELLTTNPTSEAPPSQTSLHSDHNIEPIVEEQVVESYAVEKNFIEPIIDQTPTNTPPSNPKAPPTIVEVEDNRPSETIRFDTPKDGSGNVIEDMVPEEEVVLPEPLPEIHDDAAFATKSRSMQTAKYRESLSPIPELSILDKPDPDRKPSYTQAELTQLSELLEIKLQDFNVKAEVVNAIPGPVVTRFEVELAPGIKASKVTGISRDLARSLSMASLRVVEVIPGKPYIGIEVPNKKRAMVRLIELLTTEKYNDPKAQISMAMGKDIGGKPIITDLARAPHMLVAGTTGSGKSVLVNAMLLSMLLKYAPTELRLILIDPKQLELANYNDIPHLLTPVVTDMNEAASALSWCVAEMERRYQLMSLLKVRKLGEFNKKVIAAEKAGNPMIDPLWRPNDSVSIDQAPKIKTLPMIVIVADEFADMIMQVGKQAEELITRLAQKSRAAGIHLMLATQRPSVDVITGLIKANIPVRAALRVNSKIDSRTILDAGGAEDMLGNGDMLFLGPGQIEPERVHGAYVSDEEVNRVCDAWRERGAPDYIDNMASNFELSSPSSGSGNSSGEDDALYDEAVAFVLETRKVSASSIQRKFSIGYNRAARIVDSMEEAGLVSAMGKSGKRELLM